MHGDRAQHIAPLPIKAGTRPEAGRNVFLVEQVACIYRNAEIFHWGLRAFAGGDGVT